LVGAKFPKDLLYRVLLASKQYGSCHARSGPGHVL